MTKHYYFIELTKIAFEWKNIIWFYESFPLSKKQIKISSLYFQFIFIFKANAYLCNITLRKNNLLLWEFPSYQKGKNRP